MLLNDNNIAADFSHLLKGKIFEELTSWHTGGGGWMFSLKRQEEREEDRTGRTEILKKKTTKWVELAYKEEHDGARAF